MTLVTLRFVVFFSLFVLLFVPVVFFFFRFVVSDRPRLEKGGSISRNKVERQAIILTDMTNLANKWSLEMIFIYLIRLHCGL